MIAPEVMRAFRDWGRDRPVPANTSYPLYIGHPTNGQWYVRERLPGTRVWRAGEDGSFTLLECTSVVLGMSSQSEATP